MIGTDHRSPQFNPRDDAASTASIRPTREAQEQGEITCLAVNDLNWYTTAEHLVEAAARAGVRLRRKDVTFAEHKVNGKTKGSVVMDCHSTGNAGMVAIWFQRNDFQGKRLNPSFVNPSAGNPFKPAAAGGPGAAIHRSTKASTGPRQVLNTAALLAHGPTNAHGGVNFNRVKPSRVAHPGHPANLGMGWPLSLGVKPQVVNPVEYQHGVQSDWSSISMMPNYFH